jgi:16S rRNA processing protein RimM
MIEVGVIVNTHGLRGEMKVRSESDFKADRFRVGATLYIEDVAYTVTSFRPGTGADLLTLSSIDHINKAERLKGKPILAPVEEASLNEGEYHISSLLGCDVREDGALLGTVTDIRPMPAQSLLVVNKTIQIPFVDAFIQEVDVVNRVIHVTLIEGMR